MEEFLAAHDRKQAKLLSVSFFPPNPSKSTLTLEDLPMGKHIFNFADSNNIQGQRDSTKTENRSSTLLAELAEKIDKLQFTVQQNESLSYDNKLYRKKNEQLEERLNQQESILDALVSDNSGLKRKIEEYASLVTDLGSQLECIGIQVLIGIHEIECFR